MPTHRVQQGECVESIAFDHGLFWETVWNLPENRALREARTDPNSLHPGDLLHVIDRREKRLPAATGGVAKFRRKGVPSELNVVIEWSGKPRANEPFELYVDRALVTKGTTDGEGRVRHAISPRARQGKLVVGAGDRRTEYPLALGAVDPIEELSGLKARLRNLGLYFGELDDAPDEELSQAVAAFQASVGLEPTGATDPELLAKLREVHDG